MEDALIAADVGLPATHRISTPSKPIARARSGRGWRGVVLGILREVRPAPEITTLPHVILVVGVNGTGKTTTVGKLANVYRAAGRSVLVCAADTFRAAAVEQLAVWTERAGVDLVRAQSGADPAAVTFDAITAAKARGPRRGDCGHRRPAAHARESDEPNSTRFAGSSGATSLARRTRCCWCWMRRWARTASCRRASSWRPAAPTASC